MTTEHNEDMTTMREQPLDMEAKLQDALMEIPDAELVVLRGMSTNDVATRLSPRLQRWLVDTVDAETSRRQFKSAPAIRVQLADYSPRELCGALGLSFTMLQASCNGAIEQFLVVVHWWLIAHTSAVLLISGNDANERN